MTYMQRDWIPNLSRERGRQRLITSGKWECPPRRVRTVVTTLQARDCLDTRQIDINNRDDVFAALQVQMISQGLQHWKRSRFARGNSTAGVLASVGESGGEQKRNGGGRCKLVKSDVSFAYFYAPSLEPTPVNIPEDCEPGYEKNELKVSLYGARPVAGHWQTYHTNEQMETNFLMASSSTCLFFHILHSIGDDSIHHDDVETSHHHGNSNRLRV